MSTSERLEADGWVRVAVTPSRVALSMLESFDPLVAIGSDGEPASRNVFGLALRFTFKNLPAAQRHVIRLRVHPKYGCVIANGPGLLLTREGVFAPAR